MARRNRVGTVKVPLSLDPTTDRVLEELAGIGIFGKNKAEVGSSILREWIWENEDKLARQGVRLVARGVHKPPGKVA
jgi:hypothetical protein